MAKCPTILGRLALIGVLVLSWGEWPSELTRCNQNRKVPGSNPTRRSAGPGDPSSLRGSR